MQNSRIPVLSLYRTLLREGSKFPNYNFREYTLRKVRDTFRQNMKETNNNKVKEFLKCAEENLETIKRQVTIGHLYGVDRIVVEKSEPKL